MVLEYLRAKSPSTDSFPENGDWCTRYSRYCSTTSLVSAIRKGDWKWLEFFGPDEKVELHDLSADSGVASISILSVILSCHFRVRFFLPILLYRSARSGVGASGSGGEGSPAG